MALLFLRLRLFLLLLSFSFDLSAFYIQKIRSLLWSFVVLLLVVYAVFLNLTHTLRTTAQTTITAATLPSQIQHQDVLLSSAELEKKIEEYQRLLNAQPQNVPTLINLSLLLQAKKDTKAAQENWNKARELDPNNPLFTTEKK